MQLSPEPQTRSSPNQSGIAASEVLGALSFALDLTDGQPMGHSMQSCLIGMRIGEALSLPRTLMSDLYYALILKDAGCSTNSSRFYHLLQADEIAAKRSLKKMDWTKQGWTQLRYALKHIAAGQSLFTRASQLLRVARQPPESEALYSLRCERGASIARRIGFSLDVAEAIASLDEHWDGSGYPMRLQGTQIPLLSRILNLAQTLAVFWCHGGEAAAARVMQERKHRWFDPEMVRAGMSLLKQKRLFIGLDDEDLVGTIGSLEPEGMHLVLDQDGIDGICGAFAEVIDAKSPFTYRHSTGVSQAAVAVGRQLDCSEETAIMLRRAGLLHDIGKLAIPNSILEKPGKLERHEWELVQKHPYYTLKILQRIPGFEALSEVAASHHERLDGKGYFRNLKAEDLNLECRILAVADVYDALAADRPYRKALSREEVFAIMQKDIPHSLDGECLSALFAAPEEELVIPNTVRHAYEPIASEILAFEPLFA